MKNKADGDRWRWLGQSIVTLRERAEKTYCCALSDHGLRTSCLTSSLVLEGSTDPVSSTSYRCPDFGSVVMTINKICSVLSYSFPSFNDYLMYVLNSLQYT